MTDQARNLSPPQPHQEFFFQLLGAMLVGFGGAGVLTLGFSLARVVISQWLALTILALSGGGAFLYYRHLGGRRPPSFRRYVKLLLWTGLVFYLLLWLLAYILPDAENDGLWYHNPTLHFWSLKGYVHWIQADPCPFWNELIDYSWNGYAKGVELINFTLLRAVGINRLLNAVNLPFLPLGVLGIICLSLLFGARTPWAVGAGLLFMAVPNNICHAVNAYIGSAVASSYIALFAVTALVIRQLQAGKISWRYLPALGCALGLGLGSKGTAVIIPPLLLLILGGIWLISCREGRGKKWLVHGAGFLIATITVAILVGGFWYLRNYIHTGSPLNPIGLKLAGQQIFPGVKIPFQFPPPNTPRNRYWPQITRVIYSWLDNPDDWKTALTEVSHNSGGIGLLWLFGCLPALIWLLGRSARQTLFKEESPYRLVLPALVLMATVIFFAMPPRHNHKVRYILWLYGIGLPCWALAAQHLWSGAGKRRRWGKIWISTVLAVFLAEGSYSYAVQVKRISLYRQGVREGDFHPGDVLRALRERYPAGYYCPALKGSILERIFPYNEAVALGELNSFDEQKEIIGHLTQGQAFGKRKIYFLGRETAGDPKRLTEFINKRGIRYVIWNADWPVPRPLGEMTVLWDRIPGWFYVLVVNPNRS